MYVCMYACMYVCMYVCTYTHMSSVFCSVLQCIAVYCSVLQCVAGIAVCCSVTCGSIVWSYFPGTRMGVVGVIINHMCAALLSSFVWLWIEQNRCWETNTKDTQSGCSRQRYAHRPLVEKKKSLLWAGHTCCWEDNTNKSHNLGAVLNDTCAALLSKNRFVKNTYIHIPHKGACLALNGCGGCSRQRDVLCNVESIICWFEKKKMYHKWVFFFSNGTCAALLRKTRFDIVRRRKKIHEWVWLSKRSALHCVKKKIVVVRITGKNINVNTRLGVVSNGTCAACCGKQKELLWKQKKNNHVGVLVYVAHVLYVVAVCGSEARQCVAVCCSVLQCVAVCCSVLQCVACPMSLYG